MLSIINETNKERKLRPAEKNQLVDAIVEIGREERSKMEAESEAQMKSAQQQWEESIGANEIQQSIKTKCAEINELNVQLLENACGGVDAGERITNYTGAYGSREKDNVKVMLKGEALKKYKEHKKKMQSYESRGADTYERYIRVNAILGIETVGEAMALIDEVTPELLDVRPVLAIECN